MTEPSAPASRAFYLPRGDGTFEATQSTASPWDESLQHGGPPAGLLVRAVEQARPDPGMQLARITVDMLGGIPQGTVRVEAKVVRPGRRVEMTEARLWVDDRLSVTATAWRIRVDEGATSEHTDEPEVPALPDPAPQRFFAGVSPDWGYGCAIDWRFVTGGFNDLGPARVWSRLRIPSSTVRRPHPLNDCSWSAAPPTVCRASYPSQNGCSSPRRPRRPFNGHRPGTGCSSTHAPRSARMASA
nr:thioesterase family protein [Leekyejoonella antrihumi]